MLTNGPTPDAVVAALLHARERDGALSSSYVRLAADVLDASPRSVWRWVSAGAPPKNERPHFTVTERHLALFALHHGNAAAVHRALVAEGVPVPSLRTLQRAVAAHLSDADRAYVKQGVAARRSQELNLVTRWEYRNQLWITDHTQLNCLVRPTRGSRPRRPWATNFIDARTRAITGWGLSLQPTQATVLAALRRAVLPDPDGQPFCGRPEILQSDKGLEFTGTRVAQAQLLMGGAARTVRAYAPYLNGIIERLHRTIDTTWLSATPFYSDAARDYDGQHHRPRGFLPPLFEQLVEDYRQFTIRHNASTHTALDGESPLTDWNAEDTPLVVPDEDALRWMMLEPVERQVGPYGIEINKGYYSHPTALHRLRNRTVLVRAALHEPRYVDVYLGDELICRASRQSDWNADGRAAFVSGRRASRRAMNRARRDADVELIARMRDQGYEYFDPDQGAVEGAGADDEAAGTAQEFPDLLNLDVDEEAF